MSWGFRKCGSFQVWDKHTFAAFCWLWAAITHVKLPKNYHIFWFLRTWAFTWSYPGKIFPHNPIGQYWRQVRFPMAHLKAFVPRIPKQIWKLSQPFWVLSELSWSRIMSSKMSVFRVFFVFDKITILNHFVYKTPHPTPKCYTWLESCGSHLSDV